MTSEVVAGIVRRTRAAQGLDEHVSDPAILERIAVLLDEEGGDV